MNITFRPIVTWPGTHTKSRRNAHFKVDFNRNLKYLIRELEHLKGTNVAIQLALSERDIRNDGWPRSDARPGHPGVILSFDSKHGPLSYPCDTYVSWQDNLRAIALALEALRAVDRYGVTRRAEQYTGWRALPDSATPVMNVQQAAAILSNYTGIDERILQQSVDNFDSARRSAAIRFHPDKNDGQERPEWHRLQEAVEILQKHHGR